MDNNFRLEAAPSKRVVEFASYRHVTDDARATGTFMERTFMEAWPLKPGGVSWDADGRAALLHVAPTRWLAPDPSPEIQALIDVASNAKLGAAVDVSGKWQGFALYGAGASRAFAASIDIGAVLTGRECAALTLFDSPAIIARRPDGYFLWVHASFSADLIALLTRRPKDSAQSF